MNDFVTPEQFKAKLRDLPALPAIVMELISALGKDDLSSDDIAAKLSRDPALSAKTLRMANSSFYGVPRQIESIPEALTVLGLRTVRTVVLAAGMTGSLRVPQNMGHEFNAFWRHALGAALCAQALSQRLGMDTEVGFTVGLLHDIGNIALACVFPAAYSTVLSYQKANDIFLIDAERAVLGTDHAVIGALIAEHWQFSPVIAEAIAHHHAPAMHHGPGLVGLAHLADAFSHALGLSGQQDETVPMTPHDIWNAMAPDTESCLEVFRQVDTQFEGVCQALKV